MNKTELYQERKRLQGLIDEVDKKIREAEEIETINRSNLKHFDNDEDLNNYIKKLRLENAERDCSEFVMLDGDLYRIGHVLCK